MSYRGAAAEVLTDSSQVSGPVQTKTKMRTLSQQEISEIVLEHRESGRKLARSLLRRWRARMNLEEVDSLVDLTLCEAAKRYSPDHGASFMTFFYYHLRGCLVRAVAGAVNSSNVMLAFAQKAGMDISEWAGTGEDYFKSYLPECASFGLHEPIGPENLLLKKERIEECQKAFSTLDELEREVITRSFKNEQPLVDIARSLGYSRCHISRVKKRALERLEAVLLTNAAEDKTQDNASLKQQIRVLRSSTRKVTRRRGRRRDQEPRVRHTGELAVANSN